MSLARFRFFPLALLGALASAGCERPPSADSLAVWSPADHDRAEEQQSGAAPRPGPAPDPNAPPGAKPRANATAERPTAPDRVQSRDAGATLVEATWEAACYPCHGPTGHGDGPNGPMVNAPDITRPDLLSKITDDEIAAQIRNGKNRMPKFDLPDQVVQGLVARIRANRGR